MRHQSQRAEAGMIKLWRYALGRHLIHLGIKVLPAGRVRQELTEILWAWNVKVRATLAANAR